MTYHVVLDYGHGGSKSGATHGGAIEKQLNLLTGTRIYESLHAQEQGRDLRVLLTRDDDYDVPLRTRCEMINSCADKYHVDLAVSVHYNAAGVASANGFEVFYLKGSDKGARAAQSIISAVQNAGIAIRGSGVKTTEQLGRKLAFIHKTTPPAVLIEVGYLTNESDRHNASQAEFRKQVANGVSAGIWHYLETEGA